MIQKIFKWLAFAVLSLLLLSALVFGWMQTDAGRKQVAVLFGKMLSSGAETRVEFLGLTGLFPLRFHVAEIKVSDSLGPWLIARDIAARWRPYDLLQGYIRFKLLKADTLEITRLPQATGPSDEASAWPPPWLQVLATFRVETLQVKRVTVSQALYGKAAAFTMNGWLKSRPDLQEASLTVEGGTLTLRAHGALQDGILTLEALFEEPAGGLIASAAGLSGPLSLDLKGKGEVQKWKGRLQALAGGVGRVDADIGLEGLKVWARGKLLLDPKGKMSSLVSLVGTEPAFLFDARWVKPETLAFERFSLNGKETVLNMGGSLNLAVGKADGRFSLRCSNLESMHKILNTKIRGGLSAEGDFSARLDQPEISSLLQFNLKLPAPVFALGPLIGKEVRCTAKITLGKGKLLSLSTLHAETAGASLDGSGTLDMGRERLDASWLLTLPRLNLLTSSLGFPVEGSLRVQGVTRGALKDLSTTLDAPLKDIQIKGHPMEAGKIALLIHGLPPKISGGLTLFMQYKGLAWQTRADVKMENLTLSFPRFSVEGPQTHLDGELAVLMDGAEVRGKVEGVCRDLSAFSPWTKEKMGGTAEIAAGVQITPGSKQLKLELAAKEVSTRFGQARQIKVLGRISGLNAASRGTMDVKMEQANMDGLRLAKSTIRLEGDRNRVRFSATGEGRFKKAFRAETTGLFSPAKESLKFDRFDGSYGGMPVHLVTSLAIRKSERGLDLNPFAFKAGAGLVQGQGHYHKNSLVLGLQFENILVEKLPFSGASNFYGTASGKIKLNGNLDNPDATAEVRVTGMEITQPRLEKLAKATVVLNALLHDRRLRSHLSVEGVTLSPLKANLDLPLNLSFSPFAFSLPASGKVAGDVQGEISLKRIPSLFSLVDQNLKGRMSVQVKLEGSMADPRITGHIRVEKGTYENLRTGTFLTDLDLDISAEPPRLVIDHATATDGETGSLVAEGWLNLQPSQGYPFRVDVSLDRAKLIRTDDAVATASGKLTLSGSHHQALLAGRIVVDPAEFRIPKRLPPAMTEVKVVEINKPGTPAPPPAKGEEGGLPAIKLDVSASSPGRIHLEGRGLVSEWQGQIEARGSTAKPVITGTLSVVRGQINFLGQTFNLVRGTLFFNGSSPPSPVLDALAQAKTKDITANVTLLGPVTSPKIQLSSDPPLPSDEILSRLLFGRSAKTISPVQAVQLANAINTLSGGGGVDLLGRLRRLLGVEALTVNQSGEGYAQSTVSVGKYLSEGVYLQVEKGISPETGKASLKWDVTPHITVGTDVGVNSEAGVSLDWRWDY